MTLIVPLVVLLQVMPPPFGMLGTRLALSRAGNTPALLAEGPPRGGACCGVPSSPRGPR